MWEVPKWTHRLPSSRHLPQHLYKKGVPCFIVLALLLSMIQDELSCIALLCMRNHALPPLSYLQASQRLNLAL